MFTPEDHARVAALYRSAIDTGRNLDFECRMVRADSVNRWLHCRGLPYTAADGERTRWYLLLTDIDERKRAEDSLRASENDLALIIETIPGLVWCASPDGSITYVNRRILTHMGTTLEAVKNGGWADFLHPEDRDRVVEAWLHSVATGESYGVQARFRKSSGDYVWFQTLSQLGCDDEGHRTRWFGLLVDINDMKLGRRGIAKHTEQAGSRDAGRNRKRAIRFDRT